MCRHGLLLVLVLGVAVAPALRAQGAESADARDRRLLARAESLTTALKTRREAAARAVFVPAARVVSAHGLTLVVDGAASGPAVQAAADTAAALLEELGAVPAGFLAASVLVWSSAHGADALLDAGAVAHRRRIMVNLPSVVHQEGGKSRVVAGFAEAGWPMARAALVAYAATLDAEWQAWLPADFGLKREIENAEARPWQMFMPASSAVGAGCLDGRAGACRTWLGLDRDADPYATRYRPSELRAVFRIGWFPGQGTPRFRACLAGADSACVAIAREMGQPAPVPADAFARRSLLRAIHDIYGAPTVAAALADTAGSIGTRLARATRVSEDTLVLAWRRRVLGLGETSGSRAGAKEAMPALLFAGLLLLAAAGSGRWR